MATESSPLVLMSPASATAVDEIASLGNAQQQPLRSSPSPPSPSSSENAAADGAGAGHSQSTVNPSTSALDSIDAPAEQTAENGESKTMDIKKKAKKRGGLFSRCCNFLNGGDDDRKSPRNLVAFFFCGLINNYAYVVMLSAAHDIIKGRTAIVLLADILPSLTLKLTAPFYLHRIPYWLRVLLVMAFAVACFQIVGWVNNVYLQLLGVVCASISSGGGEITFLALTSFYHKNTVSAWGSGTGGAGVFGSLSYLALRSWFQFTPFATLMIITPLPMIIGFSYFFMMTKGKPATAGDPNAPTSSEKKKKSQQGHVKGKYTTLDDETEIRIDSSTAQLVSTESSVSMPEISQQNMQESKDSDLDNLAASESAENETALHQSKKRSLNLEGCHQSSIAKLTFKQRVFFILPLMRYMGPLYFVYLSEYLINQGVDSSLKFNKSSKFWANPLEPEHLYFWYQFLYQCGVFVSRSSVNVFPIKRVWFPSVLQVFTFVFLFCAALFSFLPSVWIVFFIILWEGLLGGSTYVNAFFLISYKVKPEFREFALTVASVADSLGVTCSALISSLFLEQWLLNHRWPSPYPWFNETTS